MIHCAVRRRADPPIRKHQAAIDRLLEGTDHVVDDVDYAALQAELAGEGADECETDTDAAQKMESDS